MSKKLSPEEEQELKNDFLAYILEWIQRGLHITGLREKLMKVFPQYGWDDLNAHKSKIEINKRLRKSKKFILEIICFSSGLFLKAEYFWKGKTTLPYQAPPSTFGINPNNAIPPAYIPPNGRRLRGNCTVKMNFTRNFRESTVYSSV